MQMQRKGWVKGLAAAVMLGSLYQTTCIGFGGQEIGRSINFCFLFDCQNGAFGGLIDFCPNNETSDDNQLSGSANTFIDCPTDDS